VSQTKPFTAAAALLAVASLAVDAADNQGCSSSGPDGSDSDGSAADPCCDRAGRRAAYGRGSSINSTGSARPSSTDGDPGLALRVVSWWKQPAGAADCGSTGSSAHVWLGARLSSGAVGTVSEGLLPGGEGGGRPLVAIKLPNACTDSSFQRFRHELELYEGPLRPLQGRVVPTLLAAGVLKVGDMRHARCQE